ncbi:MAG: rhodanese-like domain-containing protein [Egibacteraceae bacterium]
MIGKRATRSMTPQALSEREGVDIIDVREADEWRAGHIAGSRHIPMGTIGNRLHELDGDRPIVAVCRSGQRSGQVTALLAKQGYDITNLDGGLRAWARGGLPLATAVGGQGRVI